MENKQKKNCHKKFLERRNMKTCEQHLWFLTLNKPKWLILHENSFRKQEHCNGNKQQEQNVWFKKRTTKNSTDTGDPSISTDSMYTHTERVYKMVLH